MKSGTFATFTPAAAELGLLAKQNELAAESLTSDLTCRTTKGTNNAKLGNHCRFSCGLRFTDVRWKRLNRSSLIL